MFGLFPWITDGTSDVAKRSSLYDSMADVSALSLHVVKASWLKCTALKLYQRSSTACRKGHQCNGLCFLMRPVRIFASFAQTVCFVRAPRGGLLGCGLCPPFRSPQCMSQAEMSLAGSRGAIRQERLLLLGPTSQQQLGANNDTAPPSCRSNDCLLPFVKGRKEEKHKQPEACPRRSRPVRPYKAPILGVWNMCNLRPSSAILGLAEYLSEAAAEANGSDGKVASNAETAHGEAKNPARAARRRPSRKGLRLARRRFGRLRPRTHETKPGTAVAYDFPARQLKTAPKKAKTASSELSGRNG